MNATMLDCFFAKRPESSRPDEPISLGEFFAERLPGLAGCASCGASLGPWSAFPSKLGVYFCAECLPEGEGFETAAEFWRFVAGPEAPVRPPDGEPAPRAPGAPSEAPADAPERPGVRRWGPGW